MRGEAKEREKARIVNEGDSVVEQKDEEKQFSCGTLASLGVRLR